MQLQLTIHNNHIHGNSIDVCSRLSGQNNNMLVIEMHVIWYAYTCIMQRRTIVVNSHNENNIIWATIISITLLVLAI